MGRGRIRERRMAFSPAGYLAALAFVYGWDSSAFRYMRAMGARTL
jgi:hypothetical protein